MLSRIDKRWQTSVEKGVLWRMPALPGNKPSRSDAQTEARRMIVLGGKPGEGVERMEES